jgi:hypothetical protein
MKNRGTNSSAQPTKLGRRKYSENLIHQWKRAAMTKQSSAELEVEQLRNRLKQVEMERDILKTP